jgi:hypothetical protein
MEMLGVLAARTLLRTTFFSEILETLFLPEAGEEVMKEPSLCLDGGVFGITIEFLFFKGDVTIVMLLRFFN